MQTIVATFGREKGNTPNFKGNKMQSPLRPMYLYVQKVKRLLWLCCEHWCSGMVGDSSWVL